jgi:class 3 adenylate cyclase
MHCQICRFTNRDGARFCEGCGVGLEVVCLHCGAANSAGGRFCSACGASLGAQGGPTGVADLARDAAAERRQLTIMFCDLVGYTALSAQLDPEDLRDLIRRYQTLAAAEIRRYDGSVAKFSGDGIMAYFGYPRAHEDDAERAVLAGLDIVDSVRGVHASPGHEQASGLSVRVGIATGEVVVGDLVGEGVSERWAVIGETPNLAARLQSIAEPNSVVISASTQRLAGGAFDYVNLGMRELKGIATSMEVWSVTGKRATASRFDAVHGRTLTPMVGREPELALIDRRWQRACAGHGQVVVIRGEGGIGKSRITQFFWERLKRQPHQRLQLQCSSYHANSALHPVIAQIEQSADFSPGDGNEQKCAKLEALFRFSEAGRETGVPLIASLLSIPYENLYPKLMLEPGRQRERTLAAMLDRIHRLAGEAPLLCIVEDVHWIDPSTLELLHKMVSGVAKRAVLLLVTCRPEFEAPWTSNDYVTDLRLDRFTEQEVKDIVAGVTAGKGLPAEVMTQIVAKADGVPLFAEELTKTVLDSGQLAEGEQDYALLQTLRNLAIPTTLHDSLMARLDRLPQEKLVAHVASVIGRSFSYDLLAAVAGLPEEQLTRALARLQDAELLYERPSALTKTYEFKHALIQDAAYQSQLKSVRRTHHEKIALALEERFPVIASTQPEVIARHYAEAECIEPALRNWQAAGVRAIERSANVEALRHFDEALNLLPHVKSAEMRAQQELQVQLARGMTLTAVQGYASPSVELAYARALELCEHVGNDQQKFGALFGLWQFSMVGGRLPTAVQLGRQLLAQAEGASGTTALMLAHRALGTSYLLVGDLVGAREHTTRGLGLYDRQQHATLAFRFGHDPGVAHGLYRGWTLWLLGQRALPLRKPRSGSRKTSSIP